MLAPQWLSTGSAEDASAVEEAGGRDLPLLDAYSQAVIGALERVWRSPSATRSGMRTGVSAPIEFDSCENPTHRIAHARRLKNRRAPETSRSRCNESASDQSGRTP
jgi:hypothetical protein